MTFLTNLTLGKRITLLTALGLILAVGVFSFLGIRAVNQATDAMLQDRLTTAQLVADYLDEALGRALAELGKTAEFVEVNGANGNLKTRIEALEDTYSRLSIYIHSLYLINQQGQIIWSKPEGAGVPSTGIAFYPSISKAITTGEAGISGLVSTPVTNAPVILLISPVSQERQMGKGALVAAIDVARSSIGGFVQPIRLGQTGYVEIVDQNGMVVARTEPGPKLAPFEKSDHSGRFADLIAAGEPTRGLCHTCHEPVQKVERKDVLAFVPLAETRWGVVIRQSEEEALAPISELRQSLLLFGTGLITLTFLFVAITTRDVVSCIRMLTTASQRIAEGDLVSPIATSRKDELGILAQTFDDMRTRLKTSYGELKRRTEELSSLLSASETLTSLSDLSDLDAALGTALDKTLEIMNFTIGGILLLDEEKRRLRYRVYRGLSDRYVREMSLGLGEGVAGKVAETGQSMVSDDISTDRRAANIKIISAEGLRAFASVPLRSKEQVLGVLNIASRQVYQFSADDVRLLEGIAAQMATAIENAQLHQEVQRKEEIRGELLQDALSIQEEERRRIARELHDETSQVLASLTANLEAAASMLPTRADETRPILRKAQALSIDILDEINRLIYELRPSLLDDLGLVAATRWLVENKLVAAGVTANFGTVGRERRLTPQLEATIFRVIQEAVNNIARHAQANNANITLRFKKKTIEVHITDDGKGFDVEEAISSKDRPRGLGLLGMRERVELTNGTLVIRSHPDGGGTEIKVAIPLNGQAYRG